MDDFDPARDLCGRFPGLDPDPEPITHEVAGSVEEFLQAFEPTPVAHPENSEEFVQHILREVPEADEVYVRELVASASVEFLETLLGPMSKRAQHVRNLILCHRGVTGIDISREYSSSTRATTDLSQIGIPYRREWVTQDGKRTRYYTFDPGEFKIRQEARNCLAPRLRVTLLEEHGYRCVNCKSTESKHLLQADHSIPYRIVGNTIVKVEGLAAFKPLCPSCNTAKDDICAECPNTKTKDVEVCRTCYWSFPPQYTHIATQTKRHLTLVAQTPEELGALIELEALARARGLL
jgi:hypothetical protein